MEKTIRKMQNVSWNSLKSDLEKAGFRFPAYLSYKRIKEALRQNRIESSGTIDLDEISLYPGYVLVAFPYQVSDENLPAGTGSIAPFAGSNYYKEAVRRLKRICSEYFSPLGFCKKDYRVFSNSRLPEKLMGALSGLGFYGRNALLIRKGIGSWFIIAGFSVPLDFNWPEETQLAEKPGSSCGTCRKCVDNCPTGALVAGGTIKRDLCLQHLSTVYTPLSEEIMNSWGQMIYGCQLCQIVCPFNQEQTLLPAEAIPGNVGTSFPLKELLELGKNPVQLKERLRGTALGMGWMNPLCFVRNGILSAGFQNLKELESSILYYKNHPDLPLSSAAKWAIQRFYQD